MIEIYTDGACSGNPGPGGWGAVVVEVTQAVSMNSPPEPEAKVILCELKGGAADTTNNRMELQGAIAAFEYVLEKGLNPTDVTIITDSKYVMDGATAWLSGWKKKNWIASNKKPVKNKDLWLALDQLIQATPGIQWKWVKGHSGNLFNDVVDKLAVGAIPGGLPQAGPQ